MGCCAPTAAPRPAAAAMAQHVDASSEAAALDVIKKLQSGEMSVGDILGPLLPTSEVLNPEINIPPGDKRQPGIAPHCAVAPMDELNQALVKEVGPHDTRKNPEPRAEGYDILVVGAGVAGLLSSIMAKQLGKKVCMIERHYMGGDCLNIGCFPSKCLIACARAVHQVKTAGKFGVIVKGEVSVDFPAVMKRMRELRSAIGPHDGVDRYCRDFCDQIFLGQASFIDAHTCKVTSATAGDVTVKFDKCMIATGASAAVPPIGGPSGLPAVPHLTNNNFFNLEELPPSMVLIGAGPIGIEMAQTMARLGSKVTILEVMPQLLPREDPDAAAALHEQLQAEENLTLYFGTKIAGVEYSGPTEGGAQTKAPWGEYRVTGTLSGGEPLDVRATALLNATGRVPNVVGIGLEELGVEYDNRRGVTVDDHFKTSADHVYSCGDCASPFKFTHAADWQARLAIRNMFLNARSKHSKLLVPWCTYTDPEIAHVGLYEKEMTDRGVKFETYRRDFKDVDRCKADGVTAGFCKISCAEGTDRIVGATIVGPHAGDLLSELTVCMTAGVGLSQLAGIQHSYPTTAEVIRQCAAVYWQRGKLRTPAKNLALKKLADGECRL